MRVRNGLVDLFSMFVQFEGDRFQAWVMDPRLRRSMERVLPQAGTGADVEAENFWALYWHRTWRGAVMPESNQAFSQLAREHLLAYVQEPCYWVAQRTVTGFVSTQYALADCFQMAIAQVDKVLKGFDSQQGFNFKAYASATLGSLIRESLRQRQEIDICTDWALLRKLSQKRLVESLENAGLPQDVIAKYILVWHAFRIAYVPKQVTATRKLPRPEQETWEAIAQTYNAERMSQLSVNAGAAITAEVAEKWLLACAKAGRAYLYPSVVSVNAPKPGQDAGEFLDDLVESEQTSSLLAEMIAQEEVALRQQQWQQLSQVLQAELEQLDEETRSIVRFYYRENLTQQEMAERLQIKQYTVSRRLTRAREGLLKAIAKWSQTELHISPTSDILKGMSGVVEEWLAVNG